MELPKLKGKHWMWAIAIVLIFVLLKEGGTFGAQAISCPSGDSACRLKPALDRTLDFVSDNIVFLIILVGIVALGVYSFTEKKKEY